MTGIVRRRAHARQDLIAIYRHLAREAGQGVADRFLDAAEATIGRLAGMPGLGARHEFDHPALAGLRVAPISARFKAYLVFYRPAAEGIEVLRVLHGARDIDRILEEEFGVEGDADAGADQAEEEPTP